MHRIWQCRSCIWIIWKVEWWNLVCVFWTCVMLAGTLVFCTSLISTRYSCRKWLFSIWNTHDCFPPFPAWETIISGSKKVRLNFLYKLLKLNDITNYNGHTKLMSSICSGMIMSCQLKTILPKQHRYFGSQAQITMKLTKTLKQN